MSVETTASPGMPNTSPVEDQSKSGSGTGWLLVVCCVAQFMVILDLSIVNVALPSIQSSLGFSSPELQWIVDAYAITFAGFLMLGGRVADHFGQRRTFVVALLLFGLASLVGGVAQSREMLDRRARRAGPRRRASWRPARWRSSPRRSRPVRKLHRAIGDVGGDERARRRRRRAVRGDHHAGAHAGAGCC